MKDYYYIIVYDVMDENSKLIPEFKIPGYYNTLNYCKNKHFF